ncbi:hypothetical protein ACIPYS_34320 [Kitasatospora sp. NPDC089913]|uniref:hypothetical protein n=1 Tax=Streptomycetaceae TaxID=2062 RepID=UPI0008793B14|nr:hypothetical protein [Streptomyces sp. TLI_053]SDT03144.1 hypothetical protein SAMN05216371_1137 [Streptomyces sp. TLI_053]
MTTKWTGVSLEDVRLDAAGIAGARFRPDPSVVLPERVEVYRILDGRGEPLSCTPAEHERWELAAVACLGRLSQALEDFYWAHGGTMIEIDLVNGRQSRYGITAPRRWPGRERRVAERSGRAQRLLASEVGRAVEEYRPVREEIALRVEAERVVREEARVAAHRAERHRRAVLDELAGRRVWEYREGRAGEPVRVRRVDLPRPDGWPEAEDGGAEPLTARELADALNALNRSAESPVEVGWDERARVATEEECRARTLSGTFLEWWQDLAGRSWSDGPDGPRPYFLSPEARRRSRSRGPSYGGTGMGGTGGFTGGHSYGGFGGY